MGYQDILNTKNHTSRQFSHVTKSHNFKNLNLTRKADRNFCGNLLKNDFRHLKFYSNTSSQESLFFERQKAEVHIFERANLSSFATWEFTAKEDVNPRKEVFLLNLRLLPCQKPKIWSIFYRKKFI